MIPISSVFFCIQLLIFVQGSKFFDSKMTNIHGFSQNFSFIRQENKMCKENMKHDIQSNCPHIYISHTVLKMCIALCRYAVHIHTPCFGNWKIVCWYAHYIKMSNSKISNFAHPWSEISLICFSLCILISITEGHTSFML